MVKYTECAPARLTIGASRLLVLGTVRISPLFRSSFVEDIAIWLLGGGVALALLTSAPPGDGDSDRLDIFSGRQVREICRRASYPANADHVQPSIIHSSLPQD